MAVTQQSDGNSKKPVEEGAELSGGDGADAGPCGLIQPRKSDGASTGPRDSRKDACGMFKSHKPRQNWNRDNKSENLSDIDDAEVSRYLNTKEEIHLKRILWEAMNGRCAKAKKQKRATETKKGDSAKKAAKTTEKPEVERRSSKINYDALKILNDELDQNSETAEIMGADSLAHRTENSPHGKGGVHFGYGDGHFSDEYFDF